MKLVLPIALFALLQVRADALVISEVMSNPTGTDNGREWIELYNDSNDPFDSASLKLSIDANGTQVSLVPLQGGTVIPANGYAVIGTIVSGQTKFLEDYPSYSGILLRISSTFTLTNGNTSLYVHTGPSVITSIPSYTASSEGKTLSLVSGNYVAGNPTPGAANQASGTDGGTSTTTQTTDNQVTVPQMTPPSPNIVMYMPSEKVAVAGADTEFSATSATREGRAIADVNYAWTFGDGGYATGSSTKYRYVYPGRYIAVVEATSLTAAGQGRMAVRVVSPELSIAKVGSGKYGAYIDIENPNNYELDLSQWSLMIDGAGYPFPKNTLLASDSVTRFAGAAMGFASTTIATSTIIKIQFPNLEEVVRFSQPIEQTFISATGTVLGVSSTTKTAIPKPKAAQPLIRATATQEAKAATSTVKRVIATRDTRLVTWFKSVFSK